MELRLVNMEMVEPIKKFEEALKKSGENLNEYKNNLRKAIHFLANKSAINEEKNGLKIIGFNKNKYLTHLNQINIKHDVFEEENRKYYFPQIISSLQKHYFGENFISATNYDEIEYIYDDYLYNRSDKKIIVNNEIMSDELKFANDILNKFDECVGEKFNYLNQNVIARLDRRYYYEADKFYSIEKNNSLFEVFKDIKLIQNIMIENQVLSFQWKEVENEDGLYPIFRLTKGVKEFSLLDMLSFAYIYTQWVIEVQLETFELVEIYAQEYEEENIWG